MDIVNSWYLTFTLDTQEVLLLSLKCGSSSQVCAWNSNLLPDKCLDGTNVALLQDYRAIFHIGPPHLQVHLQNILYL